MIWDIHYYASPSGQEPTKVFIETLDTISRAKLARQLDLLEHYGNAVRMPHVRAMSDGLFELRVRGHKELRLFFVFAPGCRIFILHCFVKKRQETPFKELATARKRKLLLTLM